MKNRYDCRAPRVTLRFWQVAFASSLAGKPVPVEVTIEVTFTLKK